MFGLGFIEILVILTVVLLVFGPEKLPELSRTLGRSLGQLRRAADDFKFQLSVSDLDPDLLDDVREIRSIADDCPDNPDSEDKQEDSKPIDQT